MLAVVLGIALLHLFFQPVVPSEFQPQKAETDSQGEM